MPHTLNGIINVASWEEEMPIVARALVKYDNISPLPKPKDPCIISAIGGKC